MRPRLLLLGSALLTCASSPTWAMEQDDVQLHGYLSQGYLVTTNGNNYDGQTARDPGASLLDGGGTAHFTEVGINVTAKPYDRVTIGIQVAANDFGRYFGMKPQIDWVYGKYELPKVRPWLDANVAVGRVKFGHALYNDYRDLDMTRTSVFLPQSNYAPSFRDLYLAGNGVQLNLSCDAGSFGSFDLSGFFGATTFDKDNGPLADNFSGSYRSIDIGGPQPLINAVDSQSLSVKRMEAVNLTWNTPAEGLRLKGSLLAAQGFEAAGTWTVQNPTVLFGPTTGTGPAFAYSTKIPRYFQVVASAEYQRGDWTFAAEYSHDYFYSTSTSTALDPTVAAMPGLGQLSAERYTVFDSGYISATWQATPRWSVYGSVCATNYGDDEHYDHDNMHRGYSAAVRYDITPNFLLKAEFERNEGSFLLLEQDNPEHIERWWNLIAIKGSFDF